MKISLGKATIILLLAGSSVSLSGCLSQSETSDVNASAPPGNTPPTGNTAPFISGNPASAVQVGSMYSFTPNASDPDGDPLTFSVQNKPSWANFNSSNGRLSGVAPLGTEGNYANIRITVSDGSATASTPDFNVRVTQVALGQTTVSWQPPTQNTDGSPLNDLAAYKVYYGTTEGDYPNQILVDNPGLTTLVVDNLVPDTYFFVSTSINASGIESSFSNVATKVVN